MKLCSCWFSAQRLVRRDYSHGAAEPRRLFHRTEQNLSSVPWCLRVKLCSCWFSAQRLVRGDGSHGDAEPRRLFHSTRTEPKLRALVPPCETLLLMVQCSMTRTTLLLTLSHGDTEAHPSYRTEPKLRASVPPCETPLLMVQCSMTRTTLLLTRRRGDTEAHPPHRTQAPCLGFARWLSVATLGSASV